MVDFKYINLIIIFIFLLPGYGWCATDSVEDVFYQGDIKLYPQPVPVAKVKREANIARSKLAMAYRGFPEATGGRKNKSVNVRVSSVEVVFDATEKQSHVQTLKISTIWKNVHTRQKVDRKSLEKKPDRTMGAGGFFSGSSKGEDNASQQVEKDIAYKIPKWGEHLFLLVDGIAYAIDSKSAELTNGANPSKGFVIARHGQEQDAKFLFQIPMTAKNVSLKLFDNASGHIEIPLAGDSKLAAASGFPKGLIAQAKTADLELGIIKTRSGKGGEGLRTTGNWSLLTVDLIGKSYLKKGRVASFADIDASKYVWLEGDGGFVFEPERVLNKSKKRLRFTPEHFSVESIRFLIPDNLSHFRLAVRNGGEISYLNLSSTQPEIPPRPFIAFKDGMVAEWQFYSISRTKDSVFVDMGIKGLDLNKGLEIKPYQQIRLDGNKQKVKPDQRRSQALAFGAKRLVVVPPNGLVRFVLAFEAVDDPLSVHIKGLRTEDDIPVNQAPEGDLAILAISSPVVEEITDVIKQKKTVLKDDDKRDQVIAGMSKDESSSQKQGKTFNLPDWDLTRVIEETESGDGVEHAIDLGKSLVARGHVGSKTDRYDLYYFEVEGKPQLWAIEVAGSTVASLAYLDSSQKELIKRSSDRKTGEARMANLLLMPGRHWVKVTGTKKAGEYLVRALAIGEVQTDNELEPNNDDAHANAVLVGESVNGLMEDGDMDMFRFSLSAQEHLYFIVEPSTKMKAKFAITGAVKIREVIAKSAGENISYQGVFPPGDYLLRIRMSGTLNSIEPYRLKIIRKSPFTEPGKDHVLLPVDMEVVEKRMSVAAYWPQSQHISKSIRIKNSGQTPLQLTLAAWSSNTSWHVQPRMDDLVLAAGETKAVPVDIEIEPDAAGIVPVSIVFSAKDRQGRMQDHRFRLDAVCGAEPVKSASYFHPPKSLLGGLNVAWHGLGAKNSAESLKVHRSSKGLFDGMTPVNGGLNMPIPKQGEPVVFTVKLATTTPVSVAGMALNPLSGCSSEYWVRDFEVELSSDGNIYKKVLSKTLSRQPIEQYFVLKSPVQATHARLRVLTNQGERAKRLCLGEWKVIASTETNLHPNGLNIASPELGGHIVWRTFRAVDGVAHELLAGAKRLSKAYMLNDLPNEWVLGFQHNRMARISRIEWERAKESSKYSAPLTRVRLAISQNGPAGPWETLGEWNLNEKNSVSSYPLKNPVWARYIRFTAEVEKSQSVGLPRQIRVFEQKSSPAYRSIVGEWGHYSWQGPYEWQEPNSNLSRTIEAGSNDSRQNAVPVKYKKDYRGTVSLGSQSAWYRFVVPQGSNLLEWVLSGYPSLSVRPLLMAQDGRLIPVRSQKISLTKTRYVADVEAGNTYFMKVEEPPRSVVFAWDNSGSVARYSPAIYQAMRSFVEQIKPGREYVNILPFQDKDPAMLLEQWSDQPLMVLKDLNEYPGKDASSNAELNLKKAVEELEDQDGNRAIIIITDAESGKTVGNADLWEPINRVYPRIFSFEMHSGRPASQDKMQDWASVNAGYYSFFRNQSDLDVGFDRAVCMLRRPANFELVATTGFKKPVGPGGINVEASRGSGAAIEIILDASGSMYKKLGKTTRIAIAKSVLKDLMKTSLPQDVPLALRIYGHRKEKSCDTKLEMPLKPFKPKNGIHIIDQVDPKNRSKTPLAESLMLVDKDMESASGRRLVILLTDGEESCGGDPEEAIRFLREQGHDVQLNIVGLAIDSEKTAKKFTHWAKLGGGMYFAANDGGDLKTALEKALFPKYQLINTNGEIAIEAVADGSSAQVSAGAYKLKVLTTPIRDMGEVRIQEGKILKVEVKN